MMNTTPIAFFLLMLFLAACSQDNRDDTSLDAGTVSKIKPQSDTIRPATNSSILPRDNRPEHSPEVNPFDLLFEYESFTSNAQYGDTGKQQVTFYLLDSTIWRTGWYVNRKKHGQWIEYDMEGRVFTKGSYSNGVPVGVWEYYDTQGKVQCKVQQPDTLNILYTFPFGEFHPVLFTLYHDGRTKRIQLLEDDMQRGERDTLLLKGKLFTGILIQEDVPTQPWKSIITFKNGVFTGEDIGGGVRSFKLSDQLDGMYISYCIPRYGAIHKEGCYRNGAEEGIWNLYIQWDSTTFFDEPFLVAKVRYHKGNVKDLLFLHKNVRRENDSTLIYNGVDILEGTMKN